MKIFSCYNCGVLLDYNRFINTDSVISEMIGDCYCNIIKCPVCKEQVTVPESVE